MNTLILGIGFGFMLGNAFRKLLVPITEDGSTESQIQEEAYIAGYEDGLDRKHGHNLTGFVYYPPEKSK